MNKTWMTGAFLAAGLALSSAGPAPAGVFPTFSCDDHGCLVCAECDDDGVCVCDQYLLYEEIVVILNARPRSIVLTPEDDEPDLVPRLPKRKTPLHEQVRDAITSQGVETEDSTFWDCGKHLCCVGDKGCQLAMETCDESETSLGVYDPISQTGTCYRD